MDNPEQSLAQLQAWMQAMLVHSDGPTAETLLHIAPSPTLSAPQRLAIYQRGYYARLVQCLEGQYKALCHALGKELFDDFAREYLLQFPSESPTLAVLGEHFSAYLENTRPDKDLEKKELWVDFMVDLARFEWDLYLSFDAPGQEGKPYATPNSEDHSLRLQPCFFLYRYRFPVSAYYEGVARGEDPEIPLEEPHFVAIVRKDYRIVIFVLTEMQYRFLELMIKEITVKNAVKRTAVALKMESVDIQVAWKGWREKWLSAGFFSDRLQ